MRFGKVSCSGSVWLGRIWPGKAGSGMVGCKGSVWFGWLMFGSLRYVMVSCVGVVRSVPLRRGEAG